MTNEEYTTRIAVIRAKAAEEIRMLAKEYVATNAKYHDGDVITDGSTIIKVTGVNVHIPSFHSNTPPMYSYKGVQLTKKLEPRKDGAIGHVFPDRIK